MKNTRREGPGRCAFMMQCHQFFGGTALEKRECPIFSVLPKRPLSANKTAVRMRTDDCGATCDHRESGFITECGRLLPPS